jgi:hypothetical protein
MMHAIQASKDSQRNKNIHNLEKLKLIFHKVELEKFSANMEDIV